MRKTQRIVISSFDNTRNPHYGGGGGAVVEMVAGFLNAQFDVTVLTAGRRRESSVRDGVSYRHLPIAWAGPRAGQMLYHALLPYATRRIPHDLWIESFTPPFSTSFLPLFSPARVVGLAQNLSGAEMWGRYRVPFFLIERFGLRFYRHILVLTSADHAVVSRHSRSATVRVMPNSVELPEVDDSVIGRGEHILFLGRIDIWHKGLDLLLQAYQRSGVAMPLVVAGNGTANDERRFSAMLGATGGSVQWLGRVTGDRKIDLLKRSAFVVMPSRHETFGISALEGMSYGKPVVHFDVPTLRWMDGDVRVRPFDIEALADQIRVLANGEQVRRDLGRVAHAAAQGYGIEEMSRRYVAFVRQVLAPAPT